MVEWDVLKCTLEKLGFSLDFVELIMRCISTSSFFGLINGLAKGLIQPQTGLRQGCPLSLYLFILCVETFTNLLKQAECHRMSVLHNEPMRHLDNFCKMLLSKFWVSQLAKPRGFQKDREKRTMESNKESCIAYKRDYKSVWVAYSKLISQIWHTLFIGEAYQVLKL